MKLIIDFDDTLFSAKDFKEFMFLQLEGFGIDKEMVAKYYLENRGSFTNPRNFFLSFVLDNGINISVTKIDEIVLHLFSDLKKFLNQELIDIIKSLGPENCFIVSTGEEEHQRRKINSCEIEELFGEIHIVGENKNEAIEGLMAKFKEEDFVFVDDKTENIKRAKQIVNKDQELHVVHYPTEIDRLKSLMK